MAEGRFGPPIVIDPTRSPQLRTLLSGENGAALFVHLGLLSDGRLQQGLAELRREGKTREEAHMISLQRMQPLAIIGWVLAETSTILGLVLAILGEVPFGRFVFFLALGVTVHLACRPRLSRIESLLRATYV